MKKFNTAGPEFHVLAYIMSNHSIFEAKKIVSILHATVTIKGSDESAHSGQCFLPRCLKYGRR